MSRRSWSLGLPLLAAAIAAGAAWTWAARELAPGDPADIDQVALGAALSTTGTVPGVMARISAASLAGREEATDLTDEEIEKVAERLGDVAPAHDDSGRTSRLDDAALFKIIDEGAAAVLDKPNSRMSGFGDQLAEEEIWAIIAFMKRHWQDIEVAAD